MQDLGGWLHDLDPVVFRVWGPVAVRWYGLSYLAGFVIAWLVLRLLAGRGVVRIPAPRAADAILMIAAGAVVGGRLGYAVFYQPSLLWSFGGEFPFWGMLALNQGGMASHGGMIGVVVAGWLVSRGFRTEDGSRVGSSPTLHVLDACALVAPFGLLLGRLANFVNGELLGKIVARPGVPAPWWAVRFPQERLERPAEVPLSPEQQAALEALLVDHTRLLSFLEAGAGYREAFAAAYAELLDKLRAGVPGVAARLEPLLAARHPSQLYQAAAEGLVVGAAVWAVAAKPRRPGVVSAWFLMVYGVLRIATEYWRLPDAQFAVGRPLGLSRGQWLSAGMVLAGAVLLAWAARLSPGRRSAPRLLGWAAARPGSAPAGSPSAEPGETEREAEPEGGEAQ